CRDAADRARRALPAQAGRSRRRSLVSLSQSSVQGYAATRCGSPSRPELRRRSRLRTTRRPRERSESMRPHDWRTARPSTFDSASRPLGGQTSRVGIAQVSVESGRNTVSLEGVRMANVLLFDDEADFVSATRELLTLHGHSVDTAERLDDARRILCNDGPE